jgi:hypothetical protein
MVVIQSTIGVDTPGMAEIMALSLLPLFCDPGYYHVRLMLFAHMLQQCLVVLLAWSCPTSTVTVDDDIGGPALPLTLASIPSSRVHCGPTALTTPCAPPTWESAARALLPAGSACDSFTPAYDERVAHLLKQSCLFVGVSTCHLHYQVLTTSRRVPVEASENILNNIHIGSHYTQLLHNDTERGLKHILCLCRSTFSKPGIYETAVLEALEVATQV